MRNLVYIVILMFALMACKPQQQYIERQVEIPVETVKIEYVHDTRVDSVFVRDSVDRWMKGDTVYIYKEHTGYKYLLKTDTVIKVDSVPVILTNTVETVTVKEVKTNYLKWYQEALMWIGGVLLLTIIGYILYKIKKK